MKKQFFRLISLVILFYACDKNTVEDLESVNYQTAIIGTWHHTHKVFIYENHYDTVNVLSDQDYKIFSSDGSYKRYKELSIFSSGKYKIKDDSLIYMSSNGIPVREKHTIRKLDGDILQVQNISEYIDRDTLIYIYKRVGDLPL